MSRIPAKRLENSLRTVCWEINGQALNLAKLKEAKYGERKCGSEQSRLLTIDVNQMHCPANEKMLVV